MLTLDLPYSTILTLGKRYTCQVLRFVKIGVIPTQIPVALAIYGTKKKYSVHKRLHSYELK